MVSKSDFLDVFLNPLPRWPPRRPRTDSKARRHVEMEAKVPQRTREVPHRPPQSDSLTATKQGTIVPCFWLPLSCFLKGPCPDQGGKPEVDASPMLPRCFQMLPDASRCFQMLPDASRRFQMLPDASRCFQMPNRCLPDASRCFQMLSRWLQMLPDASRCLQMPPEASRCFQLPPRCLPDASLMPP